MPILLTGPAGRRSHGDDIHKIKRLILFKNQRSVSAKLPPRGRPAYSTKQATMVMSSSLPPVGTFFCICSNRLSCTSPASTASAMNGDG